MTRILVWLILGYRATLGRFLGGHCRYHPSCSQYAIEALHLHGPWRGSIKSFTRFLRCNPFGGSGFDPP